ncbi:MAG: hypothetical protein IJR13_01975 [Bacteroidales bacterium]|nr:hypothetical protein [Bacteroidales bacterium]
MKHISILFIIAVSFLFTSCLKDFNDLGYSTVTTYTGHVVDKNKKTPLTNATVEILYGYYNTSLYKTKTNLNGDFSITVEYEKIPKDEIALIKIEYNSENLFYKNLRGAGEKSYDYGTIEVDYGSEKVDESKYNSLYTFSFGGRLYRVGPLSSKAYSFNDTWDYVSSFTYAGYTGWIMPTTEMLDKLNDKMQSDSYEPRKSLKDIPIWAYEELEEEGMVYPFKCVFPWTSAISLSKEKINTGTAYILPVRPE